MNIASFLIKKALKRSEAQKKRSVEKKCNDNLKGDFFGSEAK